MPRRNATVPYFTLNPERHLMLTRPDSQGGGLMSADRTYIAQDDTESARLRTLVALLGDTNLPRPTAAGWQDLGKPAINSMQASLWQPLRLAGIHRPVAGFGRWLREG